VNIVTFNRVPFGRLDYGMPQGANTGAR
jgi:hypothetical protein